MGKKLVNQKASGMHTTIYNMPELRAAIARLARDEVLVGVPSETTDRKNEDGTKSDITSAALAYIHDNGAPEAHIPARPFMIPGMEDAVPQVTKILAAGAKALLNGQPEKVNDAFVGAGLKAQLAIQNKINEGIPPPLADSTVRKRAAKGRKGAQEELNRRAAGYGASLQLAKPLVDTGEMRKSITYVIRNRSQRSS